MKTFELDFTSIAKTVTTCDHCGKQLGGRYVDKPGSISMYLDDGEDSYGNKMTKEHLLCGEKCARDHLNKRANKAKG